MLVGSLAFAGCNRGSTTSSDTSTTPRLSTKQADSLQDMACVTLALQIEKVDGNGTVIGTVAAINQCSFDICFIGEPLEVLTLSPDTRALWAGPENPFNAVSRVIFFQEGTSLGRAFRGDAAFTVLGGPGVIRVRAGESRTVPVRGESSAAKSLSGGTWQATFLAPVFKAVELGEHLEVIDPGASVAVHNAKHQKEGRASLPKDAVMGKCGVSRFEIPRATMPVETGR
jgi:hypothetical protein